MVLGDLVFDRSQNHGPLWLAAQPVRQVHENGDHGDDGYPGDGACRPEHSAQRSPSTGRLWRGAAATGRGQGSGAHTRFERHGLRLVQAHRFGRVVRRGFELGLQQRCDGRAGFARDGNRQGSVLANGMGRARAWGQGRAGRRALALARGEVGGAHSKRLVRSGPA